jgi:hypothetical protein
MRYHVFADFLESFDLINEATEAKGEAVWFLLINVIDRLSYELVMVRY